VLPVALQVRVDDLVDQTLTVAALPGTDIFDGLPTFTPATVMFHGPSKLLDDKAFHRAADGKVLVYADFSDPSSFKSDGQLTTATVPLRMPATTASEPYTLSAPTVKAEFTRKQEDQKGTILAMPVFVRALLEARGIPGRFFARAAQLGQCGSVWTPAVIKLLNTPALFRPKAILEILPEDEAASAEPRPAIRVAPGSEDHAAGRPDQDSLHA